MDFANDEKYTKDSGAGKAVVTADSVTAYLTLLMARPDDFPVGQMNPLVPGQLFVAAIELSYLSPFRPLLLFS